MAESATRKGTREKKVPKHLNVEVFLSVRRRRTTDPSWGPNPTSPRYSLSSSRTSQFHRRKPSPSLSSSPNSSPTSTSVPLPPLRIQAVPIPRPPSPLPPARRSPRPPPPPRPRPQGQVQQAAQTPRRAPRRLQEEYLFRKADSEGRENWKGEGGRKGQSQARVGGGGVGTADYASQLSQHLGKIYGNGGNYIEPESLKTMELARQLIDGNKANRPKEKGEKGEKGKETSFAYPIKLLERGGKFDMKVFKRQAYHIAAAYYAHTVKVRLSSSDMLDPTYNARKLREAAERGLIANQSAYDAKIKEQ